MFIYTISIKQLCRMACIFLLMWLFENKFLLRNEQKSSQELSMLGSLPKNVGLNSKMSSGSDMMTGGSTGKGVPGQKG